MQRFLDFILILIVMIFLSLHMAHAAPKAEQAFSMTIDEAISTALARNPAIAAARASVSASSSRVIQAKSGFYPQINLSESFMRTDNPMWVFGNKINQGGITASDFSPDALNHPPDLSNYATRLTLNWFLFDGGNTIYGMKQAAFASAAEQAALKKSRQEIIYQAIKAYYGLVIARETREVVSRALKTAKKHRDMIESRYKNGLTVKSDVLRARVHIARLTQELAVADSEVSVAQASLNMVLGNITDKPIFPATPLSLQSMPDKTLDQWIALGLKSRPELKAIELRQKIADAELKKSKTRNLPSIGLNGTYEVDSERFNGSEDNYTLGATVSMNLFSGFRYSAKTEEARFECLRLRHLKQEMENRIRLEVRKAFFNVISAGKRVAAAKTATDLADEAMRIVANRYKTGLLPVVSLLDAEDAVLEADNNYNRSLYAATLAAAGLSKAAGTIDENR